MTENHRIFEQLEKYIPWGTSTCSKRSTEAPDEPEVIVRGQGCRVWDADGREFIDFRNALGPVTLGYAIPAVNRAIINQLENGISFGYPHPLEGEVAQTICEIIPCSEKARFLKTGGEAMAAVIRIARAATGRDLVFQCGYNGWLNSLAAEGTVLPGQSASGAPPGVPEALAALHRKLTWNSIEELELSEKEHPNRIAAVVVAADYQDMEAGRIFYPLLREFCDRTGTLLIFDEIVTGFRMAIGGVQEYFGITPDLSVFSKGIANGMPLSVYCGKAKYMDVLNQAIVSSTFGGETLSLAAAREVIRIYREEPVIEHLWKTSIRMWNGFNRLCIEYGIPAKIRHPMPVSIFEYGEHNLAGKLKRALCRNGITIYTCPYVNYSHTEKDIDEALERCERALKELK